MIRRRKGKVKKETRKKDEFIAGRHGWWGEDYSENSFTLMDWNSKVLMKLLFNLFSLIPLLYSC